MDLIKTHEIMENELRCVQRASVNACDRDCKHCDLLMDTGEIIQAYGKVIQLLENLYNCRNKIMDLYIEYMKKRNPDKMLAVNDCLFILSEYLGDDDIDGWVNKTNI